MAKTEQKMQLPKVTLDDLFTTQEERDTSQLEKLVNLPLNKIKPFPNHPFKVLENAEMQELISSITEVGVLSPILVRPKDNGDFEIVSGHRRKLASKLAGKEDIPCIIRNLSDEEATIIMVDSNLQREELLPSEKAFAYKMKLEAMKRQAGRPKNNCVPVAHELIGKRSREILGNEVGESADQVRRYIRLTELIPELLEKVDNKTIAFRPAVEISYLTKNEQKFLLDCIDYSDATPSLAQAIKMKKSSQLGELNEDKIDDIMSEEKPNQKEKIRISKERIYNILPKNLDTEDKIEDFIVLCVEEHNKRQKQKEFGSR